jgi:hypothetical protein
MSNIVMDPRGQSTGSCENIEKITTNQSLAMQTSINTMDADIANVRSFTAKHGCSSQVLLPFQP